MGFKWTTAAVTLALGAVAAPAFSQNVSSNWVGVEAGIYVPTNGVIRDVFGSSLPRVGFNFINNKRPEAWKLSTNFSVIGANKNGSRFLAIPVTVGFGRSFGDEKQSMHPYVRAGVGVAYLDYDITVGLNPAVADRSVVFTGVGEVGLVLSDRIRLSAAYNYFSKQNNFDFSGWDLKVTFAILRF